MVLSVSNDAPTSFSGGTSVVTWTVTDDSGNTAVCQQNVTVLDNENPTITCPSDIFIDADMGTCEATNVSLGSEVSNDNCMVLSVSNDAPTSFSGGTSVVTWTVTDDSGNTAVCQQNVTVLDNENPTITCPSDITVNNTPGLCGKSVPYNTPAISDNCYGSSTTLLTTDYFSGAFFPVATTTVSYNVTDASNNTATCSFNVTVNDNENPVITGCPTLLLWQ